MEEVGEKNHFLHTHSLRFVQNFINQRMNIELSDDVQNALSYVDGYYFTARIPSDSAFLVSECEAERCYEGVCTCKEATERD